MKKQHAKLIQAMVKYDAGDPMRIHHLLKVHSLASTIAVLEQVDEKQLFIIETAAIVHDIGIHLSEQKYGSSGGKHQEVEGPPEARKLMEQVGGYSEEQIERVCYLVGHHHTYTDIDGLDYQILIEADFLVNIYEDAISAKAIAHVRQTIFKTPTALALLDEMYRDKRNSEASNSDC